MSLTHFNRKQSRLLKCEFISFFFLDKNFIFFYYRSNDSWEAQTKLSFIEHQIKLCEEVKSSAELKHWYASLGYFLATHGTEKKVRQVLDDLLGPVNSLKNDPQCLENHKILNISKHELLTEVLNNFRTSTKWQRIYCEYFDQLSEIKKSSTNVMEIN